MTEEGQLIGRVTRCSTRGFVGAMRLPEPELPVFGGFCLAQAQNGASEVVAVIHDISIEDDEFARQIAASENATPEQIADGRENRQLPVEFSALAVGFQRDEVFHYGLPPQPPLTLAPVYTMSTAAVRAFSAQPDYLPLLLQAGDVANDELLAAALLQAARARPEDERRKFLIENGRACSRLLGQDMVRLNNLLNGLRSAA